MGTDPVSENTFTSRSDYSYKVSESVPDLARLKAERGGESEIGENIIELCLAADVCFMALHGGIGENGKLQAMLEMLGVKFTGSHSKGAMLAMDKDLSKQLLRHAGVLNADWLCVSHTDDYTEEDYATKVGYPCVIKPCCGGSSVGVSFAENYAELREAVEKASEYENSILVERKVCGRELTIGVIDGVALPPVEIIPKSGFYDYSNKYQSGRTEEICPAPLTDEENKRLADAALKAFDTLRLGSYARIDFSFTEIGEKQRKNRLCSADIIKTCKFFDFAHCNLGEAFRHEKSAFRRNALGDCLRSRNLDRSISCAYIIHLTSSFVGK